MAMRRPIRVLVVDDSPVVRQVVRALLEEDPAIGAVETAASGNLALRKIQKFDPDVVTLDVEMPMVDGIATLSTIMRTAPRPVIMLSAVTQSGAAKTVEALELGAVDFIPKPAGRLSRDIASVGSELRHKIRAVAGLAERWARQRSKAGRRPVTLSESVRRTLQARVDAAQPAVDVVAIGASTGGTEAIRKVLVGLPADFPASIVVVQHMPEGFTRSFAARLNELSKIEVKEASTRDVLRPGRALLAPGHRHMVTRQGEYGGFVELNALPPVSGHRPSVDVLFQSVAETYGGRAIGVLLTGMGRDGADGMKLLKQGGAMTIAQDAGSCVVFGMPRMAIQEGGASLVANIADIGEILIRSVAGGSSAAAHAGKPPVAVPN